MSKIRSHVNRCGFSRRPVSTFDREPDRAVVRGLEQRRDGRRRQGGDIAQILQEQMRRLGEERNRGQPTSLGGPMTCKSVFSIRKANGVASRDT